MKRLRKSLIFTAEMAFFGAVLYGVLGSLFPFEISHPQIEATGAIFGAILGAFIELVEYLKEGQSGTKT